MGRILPVTISPSQTHSSVDELVNEPDHSTVGVGELERSLHVGQESSVVCAYDNDEVQLSPMSEDRNSVHRLDRLHKRALRHHRQLTRAFSESKKSMTSSEQTLSYRLYV